MDSCYPFWVTREGSSKRYFYVLLEPVSGEWEKTNLFSMNFFSHSHSDKREANERGIKELTFSLNLFTDGCQKLLVFPFSGIDSPIWRGIPQSDDIVIKVPLGD
jgi:hypothetical protein